MSWQRVLELARRQGMPVIVTDVAGREPMVVMPLEAYEAITEAPTSVDRPAVSLNPSPKETKSIRIPVVERNGEKSLFTELAKESFPIALESIAAPVEMVEGTGNTDISMEERFYLEPVDNESEA
jgi:hypothetical protein